VSEASSATVTVTGLATFNAGTTGNNAINLNAASDVNNFNGGLSLENAGTGAIM